MRALLLIVVVCTFAPAAGDPHDRVVERSRVAIQPLHGPAFTDVSIDNPLGEVRIEVRNPAADTAGVDRLWVHLLPGPHDELAISTTVDANPTRVDPGRV